MKNKIWKWGVALGLTTLTLWIIATLPLLILGLHIPTWWVTLLLGILLVTFYSAVFLYLQSS